MEGYKCDTCEKFQSIYSYITLQRCTEETYEMIGYYHFCSYQCLLKFIIDELKKQNPENRFIYGEKK